MISNARKTYNTFTVYNNTFYSACCKAIRYGRMDVVHGINISFRLVKCLAIKYYPIIIYYRENIVNYIERPTILYNMYIIAFCTGDNDYMIVLMCKYLCCINLEIVISVFYLVKHLKSKNREIL